MEMQYFKEYSPELGRDMECKLYGHAGRPMLYIPCQDGRFFDFENFHMTDTLAPWIESGQIMVLSIDTMDQETWSDAQGNPYWRIRRYEQWLRYITREVAPMLQHLAQQRNGWSDLRLQTGFIRFPRQIQGKASLAQHPGNAGTGSAYGGVGSFIGGLGGRQLRKAYLKQLAAV